MKDRVEEIVLIAVPVIVEAAVVMFAIGVALLWCCVGSGRI